jgi:hypothetical protein
LKDLLELFGRLHPLILHAPLGAAAALALLELWSALRRRELLNRRELAVFVALTSLLSAASGWLLAREDYAGETLMRHRWAGVTLAVLLCAVAAAARAERTRSYQVALVLALAVAVAAGHWGATLTHGPGYFEPGSRAGRELEGAAPGAQATSAEATSTEATSAAPLAGAISASVFDAEIAPLFARHCAKCHGPSKQKARLALHTPEGLAAGSINGPVIVPGDPAASELLRRLRLPIEDEEHMPPPDEPQPDAAELARLEAWIQAGAELPAPARFP